MTDERLEILRLRGEVELLMKQLRDLAPDSEREASPDEIAWWREEMLFWRTKFLREHPNLANTDYVHNARLDEGTDDVMVFF